MVAVGPDGNFLVNDGSGSRALVSTPAHSCPTASAMTNQMLTPASKNGENAVFYCASTAQSRECVTGRLAKHFDEFFYQNISQT